MICNIETHTLAGSPLAYNGTGLVTVFYSKSRRVGVLSNEKDADFILRGEHYWNMFGSHVLPIIEKPSKTPMLIIGAKEFKNDQQSVGRVYGYEITEFGPKLKFTITGNAEFDKLGSNMAYGKPFSHMGPVLAISSPSKTIIAEKSIRLSFKNCTSIDMK